MTQNPYPDKRFRAWMLLQVEDPSAVAVAIMALYKPRDDRVVIRADEVQAHHGGAFNLIVPVDAASGDEFNEVVVDINDLTKNATMEVYEVINEYPKPSHLADGFITQLEAMDDPDIPGKIVKVGRQRNSPGENPWG